jgi:hypothetical protein
MYGWPVYSLSFIVAREARPVKGLIAVLLAVLLSALIYLGNFSWWLDTHVIEPDAFTDATVAALNQESSRDAMGELIVERLVDEFPLLIVLKANLASLFSELLASPALKEVLAFVAGEIHDRIITGSDEAIVVDLGDYRDAILGPIEAVAPRLVALVPLDWFTTVVVLDDGSLPDLSRQARWAGPVKYLSIIGALVLAFLLLRFVKRRGMGVGLVGMAFLLSGLATAVLVPGGKAMALARARSPSVETIIANTYDQFTGYLKISALVFALVGAGLIALGVVRWTEVGEKDTAGA